MAALDQKSPNVLLQSLCCKITGKSEGKEIDLNRLHQLLSNMISMCIDEYMGCFVENRQFDGGSPPPMRCCKRTDWQNIREMLDNTGPLFQMAL